MAHGMSDMAVELPGASVVSRSEHPMFHRVSSSEPGRVRRRRLVAAVATKARGEERGDGAVVGEARLAARVPLLLNPLAAPQDAVAPAAMSTTSIHVNMRLRASQPMPA